MAKYLVLYADGGTVKRAGSAEALPPGAYQVSKGVWETGAVADGAPTYVEWTDEPYEPEDD